MEDEYVVVLDKDRDFCRLFRSDSAETPAGEVLWTGNGLRRGYDAMIRLNKERRPINSFVVCTRMSPKGRAAYRIVKGEPGTGWSEVERFYDFASARDAMKALVKARNEAEAAERERSFEIMRRVGILSKRIPKFTDADMRYVGWLRETGRFAA